MEKNTLFELRKEIYYVYEIINFLGTIEYIGESKNPKKRFMCHKSINKSGSNGKFNGRQDIFMNIVKEFNNKKDAFNYQCELQKQYGFESDAEKLSKARIIYLSKHKKSPNRNGMGI